MDMHTLVTGSLVFLAQIVTLTIGTLRTMLVVQGRARTAFLLGAAETSIWLCGAATVIGKVSSEPALGGFYALGFAAGNVTGIFVEKWLALGDAALRAVSVSHGPQLSRRLRQEGYAVTALRGEGLSGPVTMLYLVCPRKRLKNAVAILREDPEIFYCVESAGGGGGIPPPNAPARPVSDERKMEPDEGGLPPLPSLLGGSFGPVRLERGLNAPQRHFQF